METAVHQELISLGRILDQRVERLIEVRVESGQNTEDPFRGLYLTDDDALQALQARDGATLDWVGPELEEMRIQSSGPLSKVDRCRVIGDGPLTTILARWGLDALDGFILFAATVPDLDRRYEQLFAYLNDDVGRRRASIGLIVELCGTTGRDLELRRRFVPDSPLLLSGLVSVVGEDVPFLRRELKVEESVIEFLLGGSGHEWGLEILDDVLLGALYTSVDAADADRLAGMLERGSGCVYLLDKPGSVARALGIAAMFRLGLATLAVEVPSPHEAFDAAVFVAKALRSARLRGAGLVITPVEHLLERDPLPMQVLTQVDQPVVMIGQRPWDVAWTELTPHCLSAPLLSEVGQHRLFEALGADGMAGKVAGEVGAGTLAPFTLRPEEFVRAVKYGRAQAASQGRSMVDSDFSDGARLQNGPGLEQLTRRIQPVAGWDDLVVPARVGARLWSIAQRTRNRHLAKTQWGIRMGGGRGDGVVALFFGESGTGKTMAAEVIARDLGLDLYTVNLAMVVDKYIGETEKNLEAIFQQAIGVNGVLFFDEADALFGKRSEGGDAHDRYANIEVAYLLQRIEAFDGLAILATNLRGNMDPAFVRRIDVVVDFPLPTAPQRLALWERYLPQGAPRDMDIDLAFLAQSFRFSGGSIQNVCLAAAFDALAMEGTISMAGLVRATQRELEKLGRLCVESEFGPYFGLLETHED